MKKFLFIILFSITCYAQNETTYAPELYMWASGFIRHDLFKRLIRNQNVILKKIEENNEIY